MKPQIAVFSGPNATIQNSPSLETPEASGGLYPQRLAAPVVVFVEQFSAHPLESDAAELYAPPDAYVDDAGDIHPEPTSASDRPVYRVELRPEDGLFPLPFAGRPRSGASWAAESNTPQTFYPDASRLYEEIDRLCTDDYGRANCLARLANFRYFRALPSGGYTEGLPAERRGDEGSGDIAPERRGESFFAYSAHTSTDDPSLQDLAQATNEVQRVLASGAYLGAQWLESTTSIAETLYWLSLLVDTRLPIVGHAAQRRHRTIGADGAHNILDGVRYIASEVWRGPDGADAIGPLLVVDELAYTARDVVKRDARPGGYDVSGGHGGIVADLGGGGPPTLTFLPNRKHTHNSDVRLSRLPDVVSGVAVATTQNVLGEVPVRIRDGDGALCPDAMPVVTIETWTPYRRFQSGTGFSDGDPGVDAWSAHHLQRHPLAGFVYAGAEPYGKTNETVLQELSRVVFSGLPVVLCSRGLPGGRAHPWLPHLISGDNLAAPKARLLLMACLLKFGALPPAVDPRNPAADELVRTRRRVSEYQAVFDTH